MLRRCAMFLALPLLLQLVFPFSDIPSLEAQAPQPGMDDLASHRVGPWGIELVDRDPSVKPGDDFFLSQNGAWFARTELNARLPNSSYWRDLRRLAPRRAIALVAAVAADPTVSPESPEGKAGAFYRAFMDSNAVEARGLTPLGPELKAIRAVKTRAQLAVLMGGIAGPGTLRAFNVFGPPLGRSVFNLDILQDQRDPGRYALFVQQGGLHLPAPEYYTDPKLADVKAAYQRYVATLLTLLEWPQAESRARDVVDFETRLAEASWSQEQMRDAVKTYNPMTVAALSNYAPGFDWRGFLKGAGLGRVDRVVVDAPTAFPRIARIFATTPMAVHQARLAFSLADDGAPWLNQAMVGAQFAFRGKLFVSGQLTQQPRGGILVYNALSATIGDALSALYVRRYFTPEAKQAALEMVANLRQAFDARLAALPWMSPETRTKARAKLAGMTIRVGYPDRFKDYAGLTISDDDLYGDVARAKAYAWRHRVDQLQQPFDRSEWSLAAEIANYGYLPTVNAAEVPAGSMQPPFFDPQADPAVNYGAVGALIGLSLVNGFDDIGQHYDGEGRLRDWWTKAEADAFAAMRRRLSDQYSAIEPLPGFHMKGDLVVNEAIDDQGGLLIALDAYHLSLHGKPAPVIDGFTGDQRFFLGRASMWRAKFDAAFVRNQITTGKNSPPFLRVNGPVRNIDAWYEAFNVRPGERMYLPPEERVRIW